MLMSRTARQAPSGVPVTFERPLRTRSSVSTATMRQPASAARTTFSTGYPGRRSCTCNARSASRRAARIGPISRNGRPVRRRDSAGEFGVCEAERPRLCPPVRESPDAHDEVGVIPNQRSDEVWELSWIQGGVGIHDCHQRGGGGDQTGMTSGPVAAARCVQHDSAQVGGQPWRAVSRAIVDDDRLEAPAASGPGSRAGPLPRPKHGQQDLAGHVVPRTAHVRQPSQHGPEQSGPRRFQIAYMTAPEGLTRLQQKLSGQVWRSVCSTDRDGGRGSPAHSGRQP